MDNFDTIQNICRICLVENNEEIRCVFDTIYSSVPEPVKFSEMLMACAKIEIIAGDKLSDQICSICAQNTIKLYLFKIQCEESDKTLRNRLKEGPFLVINKIDIDEEDILDKLNAKVKKESVEESDVLNENNPLDIIVYEDYNATCVSAKLSESFNTFNNNKTAENTLSIVEESLEVNLSQENDLLHRKKVAEIAQQIKMMEQKLDSQMYEIKKEENTGNGEVMKSLVICLEDCMSSSKNSVGKNSDIMENLQEDASVRNVSTKTKYSLLDSKHKFIASRKNFYECDSCKLKFSRFVSLATHNCISRYHRTGKEDKSSLLTNKATAHTGEKPYKCNVCGLKCKFLSILKTHKRTHTGEKPYKCDFCEKKFSYLYTLSAHKRIHTGEKPYKCDFCEKKFSGLSALTYHKLIHTGEKRYKCNICEKKFKRSCSLKVHIRTHTGEKPYKCDVCDKTFTQLGTLTIHKRLHTGEKLYECDVCKKKFSRLSTLIVHKRRHTGEKPYECDVCGKRYYGSSPLIYHKSTHGKKVK